jgi:hypothetical protein
MIDETDKNGCEIERRLKKARLVEPSAELKERVIRAAGQAWNELPVKALWRIAVGRLAGAAVAAVLIVSFANYVSDRVLAPWQHQGPMVVRVPSSDTDDLFELSYGPLFGQIAAARGATGREPFAPLDYMERIRETLTEAEQGGASDTLTPAGGRSRLLPAPPDFYRYS